MPMTQPVNLSPLQGAKILVLEDEYFIADDLSRVLKAAGAEPVGPAGTLKQASDLLKRSPVDAAILDLNLRGEFAFSLVEQLSSAGIPCVIVSGYGRDSIPESLRDVPNIEKPIAQGSVIASLQAALLRAN